jgi:hypothetical protein
VQVFHGASRPWGRSTQGNRYACLGHAACRIETGTASRGDDAMTAFRPTTAAGAAILGLLAGCDQPAPATAVAAQPPVAAASAVATEDTLVDV